MKFSVNHLRFINRNYQSAGDPAPDGAAALAEKIGAQLGAVEEIIPFGKKFRDVLVAKVVSCGQHPDADRLHVCKLDDGGQASGVERDENGLVQVVCGAPNVHADMWVAWLPPGATVPETFFDPEPFVLDARSLRGVVSNGMLASPRELGVSDDHNGILEITDNTDQLRPGQRFAEAYNLDGDEVIDIENKMFTHRPDCFGWLGLAREIEGISHRPYKSPDWYTLKPEFPAIETEELPLEIRNELPALVLRFIAVTMRDVAVKPSPLWLQIALTRVGLRPINNIVDYTNFFMMETGQPIHAYDYDKVKALSDDGQARLIVRHPHDDEQITLLNGKTITPRAEAMMVATDKQLVCVGGAMGGTETEVDGHTKHIIIEAANWDMFSMRRTAMAHGIFTDAVTRFTKGQSPLQNPAVIAKVVEEIRTFANGKVAGPLIDDNHLPADMLERGSVHPPVSVSRQFINRRLGLDLAADAMAELLRNVEFDVQMNGDELVVQAPFWRTDIEIPEDVVEEVGRLYGYDKLPLDLPRRAIAPAAKNPLLTLKSHIRDTLARCGANEVLTYTFVHGDLLDKAGQSRDHAYRLANALSPDLQYYRPSLTPSLLEKIHPNIKAGNNHFALFEINKTHVKGFEGEDGLPKEFERVALVAAADKKGGQDIQGAPYYQARVLLDELLDSLGITAEFESLQPDGHDSATTFYATGRAATIKVGDTVVGRIGEYSAAVRRALKLPDVCAGFELGLGPLLELSTPVRYTPLPRFPKIEQDICLKVGADVPYADVRAIVQQCVDNDQNIKQGKRLANVSLLDIYQRDDDRAHKQITFHVVMADFERTLTDEEAGALLDTIAATAREALQAERI